MRVLWLIPEVIHLIVCDTVPSVRDTGPVITVEKPIVEEVSKAEILDLVPVIFPVAPESTTMSSPSRDSA
ncbi:hypothetical protein CYMTET_7943 [Cymbomonas tetramitiformis]|uniref:Secreted protein n=1 Tax=Cymbomonas tetramitiformis TaxID=36881 RepID=A0AAE0GU02_9CHLO|nr:hypothetical protein CYMTET_7943 [Cymbomonas tetramitiformis]